MNKTVASALRRLERQTGGRVLLAVQTGCRAWGIPRADTPPEVRAVLAMPWPWYLRLSEHPHDLWQYQGGGRFTAPDGGCAYGGEAAAFPPPPGEPDLVVWELRRFLRLFAVGDPVAFEWLGAPALAVGEARLVRRLRALRKRYFRPATAVRHALALAERALIDRTPDGAVGARQLLAFAHAFLTARCAATGAPPPSQLRRLLAREPTFPARAALLETLTAPPLQRVPFPSELLQAYRDDYPRLCHAAAETRPPAINPAPLEQILADAMQRDRS